MKLAVTLTLALCCRPGPAFASQADPARGLPSWESVADSAESCLDFIVKTFFVSLLSSHQVSVELFSPDADMRDAAIKIKGLVDTLPQQDRDSIGRAMVRASLLGGGFPKSLAAFFGPFPRPERRVTVQMSRGRRAGGQAVIPPEVTSLREIIKALRGPPPPTAREPPS
ncbi:uncharacterized protein LOC102426683 [Myotis lucifugus]|uniref:uncharacterized protein LOC102426683 n=1 Tax=Myotis lucifugus TaxID=59463 RepID=UPI000CCC6BC6|nr:uncharacterized protein LOC102426683 [Myotis lucifugus]